MDKAIEDEQKLTLNEHINELRKRVVYSLLAFVIAFVVCYFFSENIYGFLVAPLAKTYNSTEGKRLIYTGLAEAFLTYLKVAFYSAIFVSFPFWASQAYIFLAPALYKKEKKVLFPFLIATPILFLLGGALVYYFIFPAAWSFFLSFESLGSQEGLPIELEARVSEYLSLVISLIISFGVAFQMPILLTLLVKTGFITTQTLKTKRKYALIIVLLIAAFLTPPDIISQIGLATAMMMLYECSIFVCRWVNSETNEVTNKITHDTK